MPSCAPEALGTAPSIQDGLHGNATANKNPHESVRQKKATRMLALSPPERD